MRENLLVAHNPDRFPNRQVFSPAWKTVWSPFPATASPFADRPAPPMLREKKFE